MTEDYCARSEIDDALEDDYFDHVTQDFQLQQLITV